MSGDEAPRDWSASTSSQKPSDAIRQDIERTRAQLDRTVDELQSRLDPQLIGQKLLEAVRENGREPMRQVMSSLRRNPLPVALIGIGLIWLVANQARSNRPRPSRQIVRYGAYEEFSSHACVPEH